AAVDFLFHVFGGRDEGVPELPQLAVAHGFHEAVDVIVRQRLQPRVRALKGNRFKKGHSKLPCSIVIVRSDSDSPSFIPGWCASTRPGISRFRVWSFGPSRNDDCALAQSSLVQK